MAEEVGSESAAEQEQQEQQESAQETDSGDAAKAEPSKPEHRSKTSATARIKELVDQRNALRSELEEVRAKMQQQGEKQQQPAESADDDDVQEQARMLIEKHAKALLERELGMPLSQVKSALSATDTYGSDYAARQWQALCQEHDLDPQSEDVQAMVAGLAQGGMDLDKAVERASRVFGNRKASERTAGVVEKGVSGSMTKGDAVFWDTRSAVEAAQKGVRAKHIGMDEIIRRSNEKRSTAGR